MQRDRLTECSLSCTQNDDFAVRNGPSGWGVVLTQGIQFSLSPSSISTARLRRLSHGVFILEA